MLQLSDKDIVPCKEAHVVDHERWIVARSGVLIDWILHHDVSVNELPQLSLFLRTQA